jgi:hypothetical protein
MPICRCKSQSCRCVVQSGVGISLTGTGTGRNPYVIEAEVLELIGGIIGTTTTTVTGAGTSGSPYVISVTAASGATTSIYTATGAWMKPVGKSIAQVIAIGGGGGGCGSSATNPGGGGGGGCVSSALIPLSLLPDSLTVEVGGGGAGGAIGLGAGGHGGVSMFSSLRAEGGLGGIWQSNAFANNSNRIVVGGTLHQGGRGGYGGALIAASGSPNLAETVSDRLVPTGGGLGRGAAGYSNNPATPGGTRPISPFPFTEFIGLGGDGGATGNPGAAGGLFGAGGGGGGVTSPSGSVGGTGAGGLVLVTVW